MGQFCSHLHRRTETAANKPSAIFSSPSVEAQRARHEEILRSRMEDTGGSVLKSKPYKRWIRGKASRLHCRGAIGSGKSVEAAIIIQDLQRKRNNAVAYFFCDHSKPHLKQVSYILATFLIQLAKQIPLSSSFRDWSILEDLGTGKFDEGLETERKKLSEALQSIVKEASNWGRVFVVLDAYDELQTTLENGQDAQRLIDELEELEVPVLLTFRSGTRIKWCDSTYSPLLVTVSAQEGDIEKVIHELAIEAKSSILKRSPRKVRKIVYPASQGIFLLAQHQVQIIKDQTEFTSIAGIVAKAGIPPELSAKYTATMNRIRNQGDSDKTMALAAIDHLKALPRDRRSEGVRVDVAFPGNPAAAEDIVEVCKGLVDVGLKERMLFPNASIEAFLDGFERGSNAEPKE